MSMQMTNAMMATLGLNADPYMAETRRVVAISGTMAGQIAGSWDKMGRVIAGQTRSFDDLRASIDPAYASAQRYRMVQAELAGMVERGEASQRAANLALEQAASRYMGVITATERAEAARRDEAQALALSKQSYEALRGSLDPLYAASRRYESAQQSLAAAVKTGAISQEQANRVLALAQARYLSPVAAMDQAAKSSRALGAQVQNASFQVGDFFVQIASGQSATMAMAQQLPQLLGGFGVIGAAAGAGVAILGALVPMLFKGSDGVKTLDDAVKKLDQSVSALNAAPSTRTLEGIEAARAKYGALNDEIRVTLALQQQFALRDAMEASRIAVDKLAASFKGVFSSSSLAQAEKFGALLGQSGQAAYDLYDQLQAVKAAKTFEGQVAAGERLRATILQATGGVSAMSEEQYKALAPILRSIDALEAVKGAAEASAAGLGSAADQANRLSSALSAATGFSQGLDQQVRQLDVQIGALSNKQNASNAMRIDSLRQEAAARRDALIANQEDALIANARYATDLAQIAAMEKKLATVDDLTKAQKASTAAAKKDATAQARLSKQLDTQAQNWRDLLDPAAKYRHEMDKLNALSGRLSKGEMAKAQEKLNVQLADSLPLVGDLVDGLSTGLFEGFTSTMSNIGQAFKRWLASMIATAAKNQIVISMGLAGSVSGTAASAAQSAVGSSLGSAAQSAAGSWLTGSVGFAQEFVGGITGPLQAGFQSAMQNGLLSGWNSFSATVNASASGVAGTAGMLGTWAGGIGAGVGLGSLLAGGYTLGGMNGTTTSAIGTAIGAAVGGPIGAAIGGALGGLTNSLFGKKLTDSGLGGTFTGDGFEGYSFQQYKGGLFSSGGTKRQDLDSATETALSSALRAITQSIDATADVLGIGADAFAGFAYSFELSTKKLSAEEVEAKLQAQLADVSNAYAGMITELYAVQKSGETTTDTLTRLAGSLTSVNGVMDTLGNRFRAVGISGAALASDLQDLFGGTDAFTTAVSNYYDKFYTDAEQAATTTRQLTDALKDMGLAMPQTRDQYRALIDSLDLSQAGAQKLWATLVGLADQFDAILPTNGALSVAMAGLYDQLTEGLTSATASLTTTISSWQKAVTSIGDYLVSLRSTSNDAVTGAQALAFSQARYSDALHAAQGGDATAAGDLTGLAQSYLGNAAALAGSRFDYLKAQAKVAAELGGVQDLGLSQIDLAQHQVDLLTGLSDLIGAGNTLTGAQTAALLAQLGSVGLADDGVMAGVRATLQAISAQIAADAVAKVKADEDAKVATALANLDALTQKISAYQVQDAVYETGTKGRGSGGSSVYLSDGTEFKSSKGSSNSTEIANARAEAQPYIAAQNAIRDAQLAELATMTDQLAAAKQALHDLGVPGYAKGGSFAGGLRLVGENGPELEVTGPSRIYSASQTARMLGNSGDDSEGGAGDRAVTELRALRDELRQLLIRIYEETRTSSRVLRKFDIDGLPHERT